jgi:hypothetical protein
VIPETGGRDVGGRKGENAMLYGLRWAARSLSVVSIAVLALFFFGEGFDPSRVAPGEWAGLVLFPLGVAAGMVVAWRREAAGGAVTVGSLLAFYAWHAAAAGDLPRGLAFAAFSAPGFLFLLYGLLARRTKEQSLAAG